MKVYIWVVCILFFAACAHQEVARVPDRNQGEWNTKVLLRDFKKQKAVTLSVDFYLVRHEKMRAEATATLGIAAASFALDRNYLSLAVHPQKKFYSGKVTPRSLLPLIGFELDPHLFFSVLYDQVLSEEKFECGSDNLGMVAKCKSRNSDLEVLWTERSGDQKRVTIHSSSFEIQIMVKNYSTKVQKSDDFFRIKAPESYKSYPLN